MVVEHCNVGSQSFVPREVQGESVRTSWGMAFVRYIQLVELLYDSLQSRGGEVALLDGDGLLKERDLLQSRRYKLRSLIRELGIDISGHRAALIHDEAVIILQHR